MIGCTVRIRSISGQIYYSGEKNGRVHLIAIRPGEEGVASRYGTSRQDLGPGDYIINVRTGTYTVFAYMDTNFDGEQSLDEPAGFYDLNGDDEPDKIVVKGEVTGIDITLQEQ
jgi:hypothetical protein